MGWDANQIGLLFENEFFLASHGLAERLGQEAVRECIEQTLQRCGVFNFEMIGFYSDQPNSQQLPEGFDILFPEATQQIADDDYRGNFIFGIG